jgi:hypothetical protein
VELARFCQFHKKQPALAARLYLAAFEEKPALADELAAAHRYNAACMACLAGCGSGLNAQERMLWRRRALGWLRRDLARWRRLLEEGLPEVRSLVRRTMLHWWKDEDLTGLRQPEALGRLAGEERDARARLWRDVDELLVRARGR